MNSTQSLRSILEQALLAQAAYADLRGIAFADAASMVSSLSGSQGGSAPVMSLVAARYLVASFGVVPHQPNTDGGADQDELAFKAMIGIKDQHLKARRTSTAVAQHLTAFHFVSMPHKEYACLR